MACGCGWGCSLLRVGWFMLEHGGRLIQAATHYGIPVEEWLDLSTGINPDGWPVPVLPASFWSRLPEDNDGLEIAAHDYYAVSSILPVAGSQAAIQSLPRLRQSCRVAVLDPAYAEHAHAWRSAGHHVTSMRAETINDAVPQLDVLVLIHPNNPTGILFSVEQLLDWHDQLNKRGGWLVVDEAFIDSTPENSVAPFSARPGLIVLRSLGKFFGLAGARVGFVCAQPELLAKLKDMLGPWTISSPARYAAIGALKDYRWQKNRRRHLVKEGMRLYSMLEKNKYVPDGGCALFQWVCTPQAVHLHDSLARQGILTRLFTQPGSLRFGLPGSDPAWERLNVALNGLSEINCAGVKASLQI